MWVFNLNDITWTWISGSNTTDELGTYTKQDDTTTYNYPGSRKNAIGWYDSSLQELWMFGGFGFGDELDDGMCLSWYSTMIHSIPIFHW